MSADNPYEFLSREEMKEILLETRDQLPNRLAELREQIALEIEAYKSGNSVPAWIRVDKAAAIARRLETLGEVEE